MSAPGQAGAPQAAPLAGLWAPTDFPLSITFPATAGVHWTSAGRRMALVVSATGGLEHAASEGQALIEASELSVGARTLEAGPLLVTPVDVRRDLADGVAERWMTALELPLFLWELEAEAGATVGIEARLASGWFGTGGSDDGVSWGPSVRLADAGGRMALMMCEGVGAALRSVSSAAAVRVSGKAIGRLRLAVVLAEDAADLDRSLQLLTRRGFAGLRAQRAQHARLLHDYGPSLSTPLPALDEAFEWAGIRADEVPAAASASAEMPRLDAILRAPGELALSDPAGLIRGVLEELWGAATDAERAVLRLAPRLPEGWQRMALSRLRVGGATVDCGLSRRAGQATVRLRRRTGPAVTVTLELPGLTTTGILMDGVSLGGSAARFEAVGEHEIVFDLAD